MKEQLAQFIEAYAAARPTGNAMLQQFAARELSAFLESIEITSADTASSPVTTVIEDDSNA